LDGRVDVTDCVDGKVIVIARKHVEQKPPDQVGAIGRRGLQISIACRNDPQARLENQVQAGQILEQDFIIGFGHGPRYSYPLRRLVQAPWLADDRLRVRSRSSPPRLVRFIVASQRSSACKKGLK